MNGQLFVDLSVRGRGVRRHEAAAQLLVSRAGVEAPALTAAAHVLVHVQVHVGDYVGERYGTATTALVTSV